MGTTVQYDGATIGTFSKSTKALATSAKWMTDDIIITDTGMDADDSLYQDKNGFITVSDDYGTATHTESLTITENGTYNAPANTAYSSVKVAVPCDSFIESVIDKSVTEVRAEDLEGVEKISEYAFYNCQSLKSVSLPDSITLSQNSFRQCTSLTNVNLNNITTLPRYCFHSCSSLTNIDLTNIVVSDCPFENSGLKSAYMPNLINANYGEFRSCKQITKISLPNLKTGRLNYFAYGCSQLTNISLPLYSGTIDSNAFRYCTNFQVFDGIPSEIHNADNFGDTSLNTLVFRSADYICTLGGIGNNFKNTPFADGGTGGTLYVPQALIETYQSATNWSTILGYENNQILPIEGSQYEHYYADGTPIE